MDALTLAPTDVAADILLRGVEEGSITEERALSAANAVSGEVLAGLRGRLSALEAFGRTGCGICGDPVGVRCCEFGRAC